MVTRSVIRDGGKRLLTLAPAAFAALLFVAVVLAENGLAEPGWSVSSLARGVTGGCLVASLLGGLIPKRSDVQRHASVTFAIFAVTALGQSRMIEAPNLVYRIGCALFVIVVIAAFRVPQRWASEAAAQRPVRTRGRLPASAILLAFWGLGTAALLFSLPPAARAAERRVARYFEGYTPDQEQFVGFSSNLQLGSTRGMLQSSKVVLRVTGKPVDYLRGAVLDEYDARHQRWSSSRDDVRVEVMAQTPAGATDSVMRFARSAPIAHGDESRWFLPRGACDLRTESGRMLVDPFGIAHPFTLKETDIAFRSGLSCRGATAPRALPEPEGPGPLDTAIEPYLVRQLESASTEWSRGVTDDRARLDAFTRALGGYGYSLDVERRRNLDAVIDLIYVHKEGHCELFATALALLGRRSGIPTRVVSGYRVTETNSVTGAAVVRERNAHTWVEAYVDGRWDTWDPTPAAEMQTRSGATQWESSIEVIAWSFDRVIAFFWNIGLLNGGILAGVLAIVLLVIRRLTQRSAKKTEADVLAIAKPHPAFEELATALARAGWVRTASEPLERFARRVRESDAPWAGAVATVLMRYAELRYGGIGETGSVARDLTERAAQVRHSLRGAA